MRVVVVTAHVMSDAHNIVHLQLVLVLQLIAPASGWPGDSDNVFEESSTLYVHTYQITMQYWRTGADGT